jgi:hypothetical protein
MHTDIAKKVLILSRSMYNLLMVTRRNNKPMMKTMGRNVNVCTFVESICCLEHVDCAVAFNQAIQILVAISFVSLQKGCKIMNVL